METISRNLEELTAFHAVATEKSFTKGAETLGASKALVSKQVKRLEVYTGSKLFHRTTRTLALTEQGLALYQYSQKIFELSQEASRRLRDMSQGSSGLIRISAPVSLGELLFLPLLTEMRTALPRVKFEMDLSNDNRDFISDGIDFALRATDEHHPDLVARRLGTIKDIICASPDFLKKSKVGDHPKDLKGHQCILHSQEETWNRWLFHSANDDVSVEVDGFCATNQYPLARYLCLNGMGIARIPLYLVSSDLARGDLIELFPNYEISTHPIYLVYLRNEYATKKHKTVRDFILNWFQKNRNFFIETGN